MSKYKIQTFFSWTSSILLEKFWSLLRYNLRWFWWCWWRVGFWTRFRDWFWFCDWSKRFLWNCLNCWKHHHWWKCNRVHATTLLTFEIQWRCWKHSFTTVSYSIIDTTDNTAPLGPGLTIDLWYWASRWVLQCYLYKLRGLEKFNRYIVITWVL